MFLFLFHFFFPHFSVHLAYSLFSSIISPLLTLQFYLHLHLHFYYLSYPFSSINLTYSGQSFFLPFFNYFCYYYHLTIPYLTSQFIFIFILFHFFYSVGDLNEIANALTKISGTKTIGSIAVPYLIRYLFINDIHQICKYFEKSGYTSNVSAFREIVPDAMGPEEWFIHVGFYGNGEKIVK